MLLADLGAQVLRIERPSRSPIAPDANPPEFSGHANGYDVLNRSRDRLELDLKHPDSPGLVLDLAASADVFIEGFRPGVAERLGIGPQPCIERNERLVYLRMTGWGQSGSMAQSAGHDINYLSMSGALAHIGRLGQPPTPPLNLVADFGGGGMLAVIGVLSALFERSTSGRGQVVDAAMVDGGGLLMAPLFGAWSSGFWNAERGTNLLDSGAPFYDCYETADGGWMAVGAIEPQFFANLLTVLQIDTEEVGDQHDQSGWPRMRELFTRAFAEESREDWTERFAGVDACVSPVLDMGEAPQYPVAIERGSFVSVEGVPQPAPAPRFSRTAPADPTAALDYQDPRAALAGWGIDAERISHLVEVGAIS